MDDIRGSLSKMKKKFKHRLPGGKRKQDGTGSTFDGDLERIDSTSSLPQPEPHVVEDESYDREGDTTDAVGGQVISTNWPQPDGPGSVPARGSDDDQGGGEADVDGGEPSQRGSRPHPDAEVAVRNGRGGELEGVYPSPSTPSIPHSGKPDGMYTWLFS